MTLELKDNTLYIACFHHTSKLLLFAQLIQLASSINDDHPPVSHVGIVYKYNGKNMIFESKMIGGAQHNDFDVVTNKMKGDIYLYEFKTLTSECFRSVIDIMNNLIIDKPKYYVMPFIALEFKYKKYKPISNLAKFICNNVFNIIGAIYDVYLSIFSLNRLFCSSAVDLALYKMIIEDNDFRTILSTNDVKFITNIDACDKLPAKEYTPQDFIIFLNDNKYSYIRL